MTLDTFTTLIGGIRAQINKTQELYMLGVDLLSFNDDYYKNVVYPLMLEAFGKEGVDWIDWYIYEKNGREDLKAWDKYGNEICHNIESLYNEITK
jgi:phosphoglycerol transferase MdoB-like AlkP superfamily enzyme